MIKVILWDIDDTLLDFGAAESAAVKKCFEVFELGECSEAMLREYSRLNRSYWLRLEKGELTKQQILVSRFEEFFQRHGIAQELAPAFNDEYQMRLGDTVCFYDNAKETIMALKGRVLQCAVTNGTKIAQDRKLVKSGLDQLLDHIFISEEVGAEKPSTEFFSRVFAVIGQYAADEVLIVGNSLTSDLAGGNNAGIRTCWFNPHGHENDSSLRIDYQISDIAEVQELWMREQGLDCPCVKRGCLRYGHCAACRTQHRMKKSGPLPCERPC